MPLANPEARKAYDAARDRKAEPAYQALLKKRREIYYDRKERQVCVDCEAGLEDDDGLRCKRCEGRQLDSKLTYEASPKGKRAKRRWAKKAYRARAKAGVCSDCQKPRAQWSKTPPLKARPAKKISKKRCPDCRAIKTETMRRYRARKAQGVIVLATERKKRAKAKLRELRGIGYRSFDEEDPRERILRALSRFDWVSASDLFDALELPDHVEGEPNLRRNSYTAALSRLVRKSGLVERRRIQYGQLVNVEINLTDAGRAEAARLKGAGCGS